MLKIKKKGSISILMLFSFLTILILVIAMFGVEMYCINMKANKAQDEIVLSNLAAYKDIDLQALGETPQILKISNPSQAFTTFLTYLKKNMSLDNNLAGINGSVAVGKVNIKVFNIYNISGNVCEIYTLNPSNNSFDKSIINDITLTPIVINGTTLTQSSIYTVININVDVALKGILGNTVNTDVIALTDIKL